MLRVARVVSLMAIAGVIPSCSLLVSTIGLTDGLLSDSGDPSESGGVDGAGPDGEARDGAVDDGGSTDDWCSPGALLCDDFERPEGLGPWSFLLAAEGGTAAIVRDTPFGNALHAVIPESQNLSQGAFALERGSTVLTSRVRYRSRLRVMELPSSGGANLSEILLYQGSGFSSAFLLLRGNGLSLFEQRCPSQCTTKNHGVIEALTLRDWHDVVLQLDFTTAPTTLVLSVDGVVVHSKASETGIVPGELEISAGFNFSSAPHGRAEVYIDRVSIDAL